MIERSVAAMAALLERGDVPSDDELTGLRDCLGDTRKLIQRRAAETLAALAGRGAAVREILEPGLGAADLNRRWGTVYALSLLGPLPLGALPTLFEVIGVDDGDLRWAAAELIKRIAATDRDAVVPRLLAAARQPGAARKMALYCLRDLRIAEAADAAHDALADDNVETRLAALAVIAAVHPDRAAVIAALVDDPDPRMQRTAAATLGDLGVRSPEVLEVLRRAEASSDASLRRAAARSLAKLSK